jgi:hypothetical protein
VTNPSPGVWHYEYAVYNQNLDRGIQSFSVPTGDGVTLSNFGFHAPPQHPGWGADGTVGNAGFSSTAWSPNQDGFFGDLEFGNAGAERQCQRDSLGYSFTTSGSIRTAPRKLSTRRRFFKTGAPITVRVRSGSGGCVECFYSGRVTRSTARY